MNNDVAIKVEHVSKKYCRNIKDSMVYGMADICRNLVGLSGLNGSGKTTMLKMLSGIFWPDKGKITVKGKVGALISVGAGFHPQLSGRENIFINGAILGMNRREIDRKFDTIVDFAD